MTIKEFMDKFGIKSHKTVMGWIEKKYIPGAIKKKNTWFIPEEAWPPYTANRAKSADAIYKSIVNACLNRKSVCANLYGLSEHEFNTYIQELSTAGFISIQNHNGIDYYYSTLKSHDFVKSKTPKKLILSCLSTVVEAVTKGGLALALEKAIV